MQRRDNRGCECGRCRFKFHGSLRPVRCRYSLPPVASPIGSLLFARFGSLAPDCSASNLFRNACDPARDGSRRAGVACRLRLGEPTKDSACVRTTVDAMSADSSSFVSPRADSSNSFRDSCDTESDSERLTCEEVPRCARSHDVIASTSSSSDPGVERDAARDEGPQVRAPASRTPRGRGMRRATRSTSPCGSAPGCRASARRRPAIASCGRSRPDASGSGSG